MSFFIYLSFAWLAFKYNYVTKKIDGYYNAADESEVQELNLNTMANQARFNGTESTLECSGTYSSKENEAGTFWGYRHHAAETGKFKAELHINQKCIASDNKSFQCDEQ